MSSLTEILYLYAREHRVADCLQTREYSGLEEEWENFRTTLTGEQKQRLEFLLTRQFEDSCLEDRASFLAGVSAGREPARLLGSVHIRASTTRAK